MSTPVVVLVPVKTPSHGKSRLLLADAVRRDLAAAFAADTVTAALAAPGVADVVVMSGDPGVAAVLPDGVRVVRDPVPGDLNASLRGVATGMPGCRVAVLCADLPSLRPGELAAALSAVPAATGFVADASGTGTTAYVADAALVEPRFGPGSAAAHAAAGAVPVPGVLATLRADVDDEAGLDRAVRLGVGDRTAAVLARLPRPTP